MIDAPHVPSPELDEKAAAKVKSTEAQLRFAEQLLQYFETRTKTAEEQVRQMQLRVQAAKERHARLKGSVSWKITKPLRRARGLFEKSGALLAPIARVFARSSSRRKQIDGTSRGARTHAIGQEPSLGVETGPISRETLKVYEDLIGAIKIKQK